MTGPLTARPLGVPAGVWLMGAAAGLTAVTAVGSLVGWSAANHDIRILRAATTTNADAADELRAGLAEANRRLKAAGELPVPVPAVTVVTGPAGDTGAAGVVGAQGPPGLDGGPGAAGSPGPAGPGGQNGADGAPGAAGLSGIQGLPGIGGDPGPTGIAGPTGPTGAAGTNGVDGQPPTSWTFTIGKTTYLCTHAEKFDPASPTYTCTPDEPAR